METGDNLVEFAKLAEMAERYDDMAKWMKGFAQEGRPMTLEQRYLLSIAFSKAVKWRRSSWCTISTLEKKKEGSEQRQAVVREYLLEIERELIDICRDVLDLVTTHLIPSVTGTHAVTEAELAEKAESKVFFLKMKGDFHRYIAEVAMVSGPNFAQTVRDCQAAYDEALKEARDHLPPSNKVRIGLAVNFSVFCFEILKSKQEAIRVASEAFDEGMSHLETDENKAERHDSYCMLKMLWDNEVLWSRMPDEEDESEN